MIIIITIILTSIFLLNFFLYWIIYLKTKREISNWWDIYTQIHFIIHFLLLIIIPIITSSYLSLYFDSEIYYSFPNISLEIIFVIFGIFLVILSIKFLISTIRLNKIKGLAKGKFHLITKGPYGIMRHPYNASWSILFLGLALIFESLISLIIFPIFITIFYCDSIFEEKHILLPLFKEKYEEYCKKTPSRLFPTPYNILLILVLIFIIYVGVLGFFS
ncbi:MAG: methyltransferase family protein [Candidatus Hermodarchaeota archaeon]